MTKQRRKQREHQEKWDNMQAVVILLKFIIRLEVIEFDKIDKALLYR